MSDDVAERNGIEVVAHQRLGSGPQGMIAARAHARTVTIGRGAIVHNHRTLNGLDDLADSDVARTDLETHAAVDATQALHNTGLDQTVLNRAGKRIRDIDLFGSGANRKQTLRILGKHRQHTKGVISLPRYVHFPLSRNTNSSNELRGRACVETLNDRQDIQMVNRISTECRAWSEMHQMRRTVQFSIT